MAISVKKLPSRGKQEAKLQILTLISELERKYTESPAQPAQVLFQMPSQKSHNLMSLSSSSSPCFSSSSGTSQSQGFEPYDMSAAYINNYNYNQN